MSETKGISDGLAVLNSAMVETLNRRQYDGNSFYSRVGGIQGLAQLIVTEDKEIRKVRHGIGPKTCEVVKEIKQVIMEAVAKDAEQKLKDLGQW